MSLLELKNLSLQFATERGALIALDQVSFSVRRGTTLALVGESGSGKSAIAQAVMGLLPRHATLSGAILFTDPQTGVTTDLAALDPASPGFRALRGRRIGLIFQEPLSAFSPVHRIGLQVAETLRAHEALSAKAAEARALDMLRLAGFADPERAFRALPSQLSGGMRQRAMIAAALVARPALVIADEPTTALDVTVQAQVLAQIDRLKRELGLTVMLITHDLGVVAAVADDVVALYRGRVLEKGQADAVFAAARHPYFAGLKQASPALGTRVDRLTSFAPASSKPLDAEIMPGPAPTPAGEILLTAEGLCKRFAPEAPAALDDVSLTLRAGSSLGLVGESGSGKSTLARTLMRALRPDRGRVSFRLDGALQDVFALKAEALKLYRSRIAYVFQDPYAALNPRLSVRETLEEPFVIHGHGDAAARSRAARVLIDLVGLPQSALERHPPAFSGGQRQRIAIARALALRPELVILDEPTSALDVSVQAQILNLLADLRRQLGMAYLFVSHNLAVVEHVAERVLVMRNGRIVESAPAAALFRGARHPYTQGLIAAAPAPDRAKRVAPENAAAAMGDPAEWPAAYQISDGEAAALNELAPGHFVLMRAQTEVAA